MQGLVGLLGVALGLAVACGGGADTSSSAGGTGADTPGPSNGGDGSGATTTGSDGGTSNTSGGPASPGSNACADGTAEVSKHCAALCDAVVAAQCDHLEIMVPYVYGIYSLDPGGAHSGCADRCLKGVGTGQGVSGASDAPKRCGTQVVDLLTCLEGGACDDVEGDLMRWSANCKAEVDALSTCAGSCLNLPTCSASSCNHFDCEGDLCCTWSCGGPQGRVCEQTCN